ncbi:hypothetical protein GCM10007939_04350 [Amylibacter marinus]|uniref:Uncharacterized protein n=1 Tax=Amylibacter marinus TaxID=1475483 RepID=A0ABQ5VRV9_9RHOB|nr:TrgA family protein [Amylibacter marinus]GLQ34152.1 hypothetical protein GCM10007939_04350 [Amylibacter marinus]
MKISYQLNTAAHLIAGITIGLTGFFAFLMHAHIAESSGDSLPGYFPVSGGIICLLTGWNTLGNRPGFGGMASIASGLRAMIFSIMVCCALFGLYYIYLALLQGLYLDPFRALFDWFRISFEFFIGTISAEVWVIIILGGAISGRITGMANYSWR